MFIMFEGRKYWAVLATAWAISPGMAIGAAALSEDEGRIADAVNISNVSRPWDMWKRRIAN